MVLPSLIPTYDSEGDVLNLMTIESQQVRDVSITWNIIATYTHDGELAEVTLLNARADSQKILMQALERIGQAGIVKADSALLITAAVMLRDFEAVPDVAELPEACRADAGYLVEYLVQTTLVKSQADKVLMAIDRFKPEFPNFHFDVLADSWGASGTMAQRPSRQPDLELVRGKAFIDRLHHELHAGHPCADQPRVKRPAAKWESIRAPERFPLVSRVTPAANQAHKDEPTVQLLDPVALLVATQGTSFSGGPEPVPLSPGAIGVVVELLDGTTVLVEFAGLDGVAYATASVDRGQLLRLHHGDPGAPSAGGRDGVAPLVVAEFQAERDSLIAALANAFQRSLTITLDGEIRTSSDQVLHPSLLVLRDAIPVLAVEVEDLGRSDVEEVALLERYKRIDTLLYILAVCVQVQRVLLFSRSATGWDYKKLSGPAARIELPALDIQVALADVYSRPSIANEWRP